MSLPRIFLPLLIHISPFSQIPISPSVLPSLPLPLKCTGHVNSAFWSCVSRDVIESPQKCNLDRNAVELISHALSRLRGVADTRTRPLRCCLGCEFKNQSVRGSKHTLEVWHTTMTYFFSQLHKAKLAVSLIIGSVYCLLCKANCLQGQNVTFSACQSHSSQTPYCWKTKPSL